MTGPRRAVVSVALFLLGSPAAGEAPAYLMLQDRLDRVHDGYLVAGAGFVLCDIFSAMGLIPPRYRDLATN